MFSMKHYSVLIFIAFLFITESVNAITCSEILHQVIPGTTIYYANETTDLESSTREEAYCQVKGSVAYGDNSKLKKNNSVHFELWLPSDAEFNGRFMVVGNGGFAGTIDKTNMAQHLEKGFAVAGGDSGHDVAANGGVNGTTTSGQYLPFFNDIDQTKAWIHNSIALITTPTRKITAKYYGYAPRYSYYNGCSTGGAQGFALAQFYPHLFDGIYAGSPGNWYSHLTISFIWNHVRTKGDHFMNQTTLNSITQKVLDECDELDGVKDDLIENPLQCHFNVSSLRCNSDSDDDFCLSVSQYEALNSIYRGPQNPRTHESLYPGFKFGSERELMAQELALYDAFAAPLMQNLAFKNLSFDIEKFDFDRDVSLVDKRVSPLIDEIGSDLSAFRERGGKMISTQGWSDPYNSPVWPIEHLRQLENASHNGSVSDFYSLFMVPGGGHCGAAETYPSVPATYHVVEKLMEWVEKEEPPQWLLSTNPPDNSSRSRKLCPWPKTAKLVNPSSSGFADSYDCVQDH